MDRPYALPHTLPQCPHCTNLNLNRRSSDLLPVDHYLRESRDPSSPIVCPELKKTQCQMCFLFGHTRSHCPSQIKSWRSYASQNKEEQKDSVDINMAKKISDKPDMSINKFSALLQDDSDTESDSSDSIYHRDGRFRPRSPDHPPPPDWIEI